MLKPNHVCAWSHSRRTYLKYQNGRFDTSGTSLPILMDAFRQNSASESKAKPELIWFSRAYGDFYQGDQENLLLIAVDADSPKCRIRERKAYNEIGPVNKALMQGGGKRVDEYVLTEEVRTALTIGDEDSGYRLQEGIQIQHALYLHDDCFAHVEPVDQELLLRLLHATLKLHSFYRNKEIDWADVLQDLSQLLLKAEEFEIVSHPRTNVVYVDWPHQIVRRRIKAPVKPYHAKMIITEGKARFEMTDSV